MRAVSAGSGGAGLHDPSGGVQDLVAQGLRLGSGEVAVEGEEAEPGEQVAGDRRDPGTRQY